MNFINEKLRFLYLNPERNSFKIISIIVQRKAILVICVAIIALGFPLIHLIKDHFLITETEQAIHQQISLLDDTKMKYKTLIEKEKNLNRQDLSLTHINETIQKLAQKNHLNIENLQWNLEQGKSIEMRIIHHSKAIFNFIYDLNQIPYLKFNTIYLTKSEQDRKLELNTILILTQEKE